MVLMFGIGILSSCTTSSEVVKKNWFQKRKYNKGYSLSFRKKNHQRVDVEKEDDVLSYGLSQRGEAKMFMDDQIALKKVNKDEFCVKTKKKVSPSVFQAKAFNQPSWMNDEVLYGNVIGNEEDKQIERLKKAKVSSVMGIIFSLFILTLPLAIILFVISLHNLQGYVKHREVVSLNSENELRIQELAYRLNKQFKFLYGLMLACLVFVLVAVVWQFEIIGMALMLLFFLVYFIVVMFNYFELFALINKVDGVDKKLKVVNE